MKIRKAYQGTVPENKILDTYSASQTDTYSCNFINGKILWTNSSPTSNFNAQTITLNSSDYNVLEFVFMSGSGSDTARSLLFFQKTLKGKSVRITKFSDVSPYISYRNCTYVSDTQYSISANIGLYGGDNQNTVPLYVVGYKTGLFN